MYTLARRLPWLPPPTPLPGDVVVRSCADCPTDYALCPDPAPGQIRCSAYGSAIDVAKRWARRAHVDVWFAEGTKSFALLSRHRVDEPRSARSPSRPGPGASFEHAGEHISAGYGRNPERDDRHSASSSRLPHPNALLIGAATVATELINVFQPQLVLPIVEWDPTAAAGPPLVDGGTLVIWNVDQMEAPEQERLDKFVQEHWREVQILSVSENEFFGRVQRGEFLETLYYRLNEVKVHVNE